MLLHPGCTKSFKFERVIIVQKHVYDGKNGGFSYFSKKTVIHTKLLVFF